MESKNGHFRVIRVSDISVCHGDAGGRWDRWYLHMAAICKGRLCCGIYLWIHFRVIYKGNLSVIPCVSWWCWWEVGEWGWMVLAPWHFIVQARAMTLCITMHERQTILQQIHGFLEFWADFLKLWPLCHGLSGIGTMVFCTVICERQTLVDSEIHHFRRVGCGDAMHWYHDTVTSYRSGFRNGDNMKQLIDNEGNMICTHSWDDSCKFYCTFVSWLNWITYLADQYQHFTGD